MMSAQNTPPATQGQPTTIIDARCDNDVAFWALVLDVSTIEIRHAVASVGTELHPVCHYVNLQRSQFGHRTH